MKGRAGGESNVILGVEAQREMYGDAPRNTCGRYRKIIGDQKHVATQINNKLLGVAHQWRPERGWKRVCVALERGVGAPRAETRPRVLYTCINDKKEYKTERRCNISFKAFASFDFAVQEVGYYVPTAGWPMAALARPAPLLTRV